MAKECQNCKHWKGDKEAASANVREFGLWGILGECSEIENGVELPGMMNHGSAKTAAAFGCRFWEKEEPKK